MLSLRLLLTVICISVISLFISPSVQSQSVVDMLNRSTSTESNVWKKFKGETVPNGVPNIVDFSYAGYKHGEEAIPHIAGPILNVTDYGAIPNDGQDDRRGIARAVAIAREMTGSVIYIPPGLYDIKSSGTVQKQTIGEIRSNTVIRGGGAEGWQRGGTTIKLHLPFDNWGKMIFETGWLPDGSSNREKVVGTATHGDTSFEVENVSTFIGKKYIRIETGNKFGDIWEEHVTCAVCDTRPIPAEFDEIQNGVDIKETHEIDRIEGNTIHIKAPLTTNLNDQFSVYWLDLYENIGFEDLHIDGNLNVEFQHKFGDSGIEAQNGVDGQYGHNGIRLDRSAHSWIKNCRFSNVTHPIKVGGYACSVIGVIIDGKPGHEVFSTGGSTNLFFGLFEGRTTGRPQWHGGTVSGGSNRVVYWGHGGTQMNGPDGHGTQPRDNLFDNYYSKSHQSSGGVEEHYPHHMDGYIRWNNICTDNRKFYTWGPGRGRPYVATEAIFVGYQTSQTPEPGYVESMNVPMSPTSLYVAQLTRRLGYEPSWIEEVKSEFTTMSTNVASAVLENNAPTFPISLTTATYNILGASPANSKLHPRAMLTATDSDGHGVSFGLSGSGSDYFKITDENEIVVRETLATHSEKASYNFVVFAYDELGASVSYNIAIQVTHGINAPVFSENSYTLSVAENTAADTNIGDPITATDSNDDTLIYSLEGADSNVVTIDSSTGQIKTKSDLDFETKSSYTFKVKVSEVHDNRFTSVFTAAVLVTLNVRDVVEVKELAGRTPQVLEAILAAFPGKTAETVNLAHLAHLPTLNLNHKGITSLKLKDFDGLTGLTSLTLAYNELTDLPTDVFKPLTSLLFIRLHNNSLRKLPKRMFKGMDSIVNITLNDNNLKKIPEDAFNGLSNLKTLYLQNNQIKSLFRNQFKDLGSLKELLLDNNEISSIPGKTFRSLWSLKLLDLRNNELDELSRDFFIGIPTSAKLKLEDNDVDPLPIEIDLFKLGRTLFKVEIPMSAPFKTTVGLSATNGELTKAEEPVSSRTVRKGERSSLTVVVSRTPGTTGAVVVNITSVTPDLPITWTGIEWKEDEGLTMFKEGRGLNTAAPNHVKLLANFPNPFNPETWIPYQLSEKSRVQITIYNSRGAVVRDMNLGIQDAGFYMNRSKAAHWDGKNNFGERISSGIYFYQLRANNYSAIRKMSILK